MRMRKFRATGIVLSVILLVGCKATLGDWLAGAAGLTAATLEGAAGGPDKPPTSAQLSDIQWSLDQAEMHRQMAESRRRINAIQMPSFDIPEP